MSNLYGFLLILCLPLSIKSTCGVGTLACFKSSGTFKPTVCDFSNSYTLNVETLTCEKTIIPNCQIPALPNSKNSCFLCDNGYVVDNENQKCVEVQSQSIKENCDQYSNQSFSCLKCAQGFYITAGSCTPLGDAKIENCDMYASPTQCHVCKPGTYVNDGKCKVFSYISNCYFHRSLKCDQCKDEYFHNFSANPSFNSSIFSVGTFDFSLFVENDPDYAHWTNDFSSEICQKGSIKNCKVYESFAVCKECEEGYYINSSLHCDRFQEAPLLGCDLYSTATQCSKCQFKYILNQATGECSPADDVKSCAEYHPTDNKCSKCESKYYLTQSGTCDNERIDSLSIRDCEDTAPNKDECATCKDGFSLSVRNKFCYKDISNCEDQVKSNEIDAFHTCNRCKEGYYPKDDKSECIEAKILRCVELVPQKNECQKCEKNYYFDAEKKTCANQFVDNCADYQEMTNTCIKCNNLYFLINGSCTDIMLSEYCFESDGINNVCLKCKPQYLMSGTTCNTSIMRNMDVIDSMCVSNTEAEESSGCTECADTHYILAGTARAIMPTSLTTLNCSKINPENGQCLQCMENSSGDGSKCLPPDTASTTDCLQLAEGQLTALSNGKCAKCRDPTKKYVNETTQTCANRLNATINANCEEFPEKDEDCISCKANFFPLVESEIRDHCYAVAELPGFKAITNCTIHNVANNTCFVCNPGKKLSANGTVCENFAYSVPLNFDQNLNIISPEEFPMINNCKTYHQIDIGLIRCSECTPGFVNIVNYNFTEEAPLKYDYSSLGINVGLGGFSLPVEKCEQFVNSYIKKDGTGAAITTDFCEVGVQHEDKPGYACIRCKIGRNATVVELDKDKDGNPLDATIFGLNTCFSHSGLTNTYPGIGYNQRFKANYVPYVVYMRYSNCSNSAESLIFGSLVKEDGEIELTSIDSMSGKMNIMSCVNISSGNTFYTNNPNCQIFGFTTKPLSTHNPNNPPVDICLACKPGYKAVLQPNSSKIQSCIAITGCNNPSTGKYLNGCSDPQYGYRLDTIENNQLIMFDEVLQSAGSVNNCLVYSNDLLKCVVCNVDYSLINGSCIDTKADIAYNCSDQGYGLNGLNLNYTVNSNQRLMNYSYFLVNKFNIESSRKTICNTCNSGHIVGIDPNKNKLKCYPLSGAKESEKIDNCLKYKISFPIICNLCASGYIPNEFDGKCVSKNSYPNCKSLTGISPIKCKSCEPGYTVDDQGKCIATNCKRTLNGACSLCNDGYKIKEGTDLYCERNLDSLDTCSAYSPTMKTCGKCKNGSVLYLFYENEDSENVYKGFSCEPGFLIPGNLPGWRDYQLDEVYIKVDFNSADLSAMSALAYIENDDLKNRLFTNTDPKVNPAIAHCLNKRIVDNCIPEYLHNGVFCSKCQNGFIIDKASNKCVQGPIQNCNIYESDKICSECLSTHYLFKSDFCSPYTPNMNCKEAEKEKNECKSCDTENNYFMNISKHCEQRRTDLNCKDFESNANRCTSCLDGFILQTSNKTCTKRIAKFCETVDPNQDKCTKCKETYWMDVSNNNLCRKSKTVEFCKTYLSDKDGCEICEDNYYAIDEGKTCKNKPDGVIQCETYSDFGKCSKCLKDHYLSNNQCVKATQLVDNCLYYRSDGMCQECEESNYLNESTNQCEETGISNCLVFSSVKTCKKCKPNYILKWNDQELGCEESGISDCLVSIGGSTPICIKCVDDKTLSTDKTRCESSPVSIVNCDKYYSDSQCKRCKNGYYLSKDWKTCIQKQPSVNAVKTNCISEVQTRDVLCDMCKPGYKKNDKGECVSCGGNGCWVCGSGYNSCNLCKSPFYMNSDLKCVFAGDTQARDFTQ